MTSHIALQLPSRPRTDRRAISASRYRFDRITQNVRFVGCSLESLTRNASFFDALEHCDARLSCRQMLSRAGVARPFVQKKFSRFDGGRNVAKHVASRVAHDANGFIEPSVIHVLIPRDRREIEIGGRYASAQARKFGFIDVVILAIEQHASRVALTEGLTGDVDFALSLSPLRQRFALRRMPRLVDRNLIRPVGTHHTHHSNQNATQCRTRQEVACPHFHEGERA